MVYFCFAHINKVKWKQSGTNKMWKRNGNRKGKKLNSDFVADCSCNIVDVHWEAADWDRCFAHTNADPVSFGEFSAADVVMSLVTVVSRRYIAPCQIWYGYLV